jgi:ribose 5-phosphate isomerase
MVKARTFKVTIEVATQNASMTKEQIHELLCKYFHEADEEALDQNDLCITDVDSASITEGEPIDCYPVVT